MLPDDLDRRETVCYLPDTSGGCNLKHSVLLELSALPICQTYCDHIPGILLFYSSSSQSLSVVRSFTDKVKMMLQLPEKLEGSLQDIAQEAVKKRQRSIMGATLEVIQKKDQKFEMLLFEILRKGSRRQRLRRKLAKKAEYVKSIKK
ncbi:hypothetical protein HAX54_028672 [Datura stramonium]|uniref:Uncharacterized protein n=1 Tax=Datura stramonium TaxID=4076 RepID=A0ABS8V4J6_DATST|nr:hypothetical protein [Datura stramonium]